jgi:hypothetical protein
VVVIDNTSAVIFEKFQPFRVSHANIPRTSIMAPPVTKRRKLEHSDSEAESEGSFADFDETNAVHDEESDAEDASETSHVDMNGLDEEDDDEDEDMDDEEGDAFEEEADVHPSRKQTPAGKATSESKPPKRPAPSLQDGVYMAETSHSSRSASGMYTRRKLSNYVLTLYRLRKPKKPSSLLES